jgi:hypothetical protein
MRFDAIPETGFIDGPNGDAVRYINGGFIRCDAILCITLSDGQKISCTPDHEFLTMAGWVQARNLKGSELCESSLFQTNTKSLTARDTSYTKTKDISQGVLNDCTGLFMNIIMAKCQKVMTFIMSTIILLITRLRTLRLLKAQSIGPNTIGCGTKRTLTLLLSKLKRIRTSAENGINPKKAKIGIVSILKTTALQCMSALKRLALIAISHIWQRLTRITCTAQTLASQPLEESRALITSKKSAPYAIKSLPLINTQKLKRVVEVAPLNIGPTYCVTVPKYGCFALPSGIIVSNCRYAIAPLIKKRAGVYIG